MIFYLNHIHQYIHLLFHFYLLKNINVIKQENERLKEFNILIEENENLKIKISSLEEEN